VVASAISRHKHDEALRQAQQRKTDIDQLLLQKRATKERLERIAKALPLVARRTTALNELRQVAVAGVREHPSTYRDRRPLIQRQREEESARSNQLHRERRRDRQALRAQRAPDRQPDAEPPRIPRADVAREQEPAPIGRGREYLRARILDLFVDNYDRGDKAPDGTFAAARIGYAEPRTLEGLLDGYREETKRASRGRADSSAGARALRAGAVVGRRASLKALVAGPVQFALF
jgi:hypothetical protein